MSTGFTAGRGGLEAAAEMVVARSRRVDVFIGNVTCVTLDPETASEYWAAQKITKHTRAEVTSVTHEHERAALDALLRQLDAQRALERQQASPRTRWGPLAATTR